MTAYTEVDSKAKTYVNKVLIPRLLARTADDGTSDVIVLDGPAMCTSTALVAHAGIASHRVHVVEQDEQTVVHMQRQLRAARSARPTGPVGRVNVHRDDVFRRLASYAASGRRRVRAMILDLMQCSVTPEQQHVVADAARACGTEFVTLTLTVRSQGRLPERLADLQRGPIGRIFRGTAYAYGYQRMPGKSVNMCWIAMQRKRCETRYRPRVIGKTPNEHGKLRVQWYGWPDREDHTYEWPKRVMHVT